MLNSTETLAKYRVSDERIGAAANLLGESDGRGGAGQASAKSCVKADRDRRERPLHHEVRLHASQQTLDAPADLRGLCRPGRVHLALSHR